MFPFFLGLIFSFLLGSFPTGYLVGKRVADVDIRTLGSRATGATNVSRNLGIKWGFFVIVCDITKALICVWVLPKIFPTSMMEGQMQQSLSAFFCVLGHIWSPFLFFKGGKGVACALGSFMILAPQTTLIVALVFLIVFLLTRYVSLASIVSVVLFPWIFFFFGSFSKIVFIVSLVLSAIIVRKHKDNIRRLILKEENPFLFFK